MDVLGLPVDEARLRLQAAGCARVSVSVTKPPRPTAGGHVVRVVRQTATPDGTVALVVAAFPVVAETSLAMPPHDG